MSVASAAPTYAPPASAVAGETLVWLLAADDTPADAGWTVAVTLHGAAIDGQPVTVAATPEGREFRVTVTPTASASLGAGRVRWVAMASKAGETYRIESGQFALESLDGATQARRDLAAIERAMRALREAAVSEYQLGGRTVRKIDLPALRAERNVLAARVRRERNGAAVVQHRGVF